MTRKSLGVVFAACLAAGAASSSQDPGRGAPMHAKGTFEVKVAPVGDADEADGATLGRMTLDKRFEGDLVAVGKGQMLTALAGVKGSGAYVAIERVTGTLGGRKGGFVFQHTGTMQGGRQDLRIAIVPDSGSGELAGIAGTFAITVADGKHSYDLEYTLPQSP